MKKRNLTLFVAFMLVLAITTGGCSKNEDAATDESSDTQNVTGTVMVAAAASLENTLADRVIPAFNESYPDVTVEGTYDSSGKLQEQIEGGLTASVFMSAATTQMDALVEGGFIDEADVINALENEVVLIKSKGKDTAVDSFANITEAKSIAIGDPASVPAGQYAQEILTKLGTWNEIEQKASLGTNVTEVLNWVAEGSAEIGIVYKTDVQSMPDKVEVITAATENELATPVIYPMGKLNNIAEENQEAADKFFEFLQSEKCLKIFEESGFKIARNNL